MTPFEGGRRTLVAAGDFGWTDAPETWQGSLRELAVALQPGRPALRLAH
jgi:hypothetical protein